MVIIYLTHYPFPARPTYDMQEMKNFQKILQYFFLTNFKKLRIDALIVKLTARMDSGFTL